MKETLLISETNKFTLLLPTKLQVLVKTIAAHQRRTIKVIMIEALREYTLPKYMYNNKVVRVRSTEDGSIRSSELLAGETTKITVVLPVELHMILKTTAARHFITAKELLIEALCEYTVPKYTGKKVVRD